VDRTSGSKRAKVKYGGGGGSRTQSEADQSVSYRKQIAIHAGIAANPFTLLHAELELKAEAEAKGLLPFRCRSRKTGKEKLGFSDSRLESTLQENDLPVPQTWRARI
jgi:hypothetical protein